MASRLKENEKMAILIGAGDSYSVVSARVLEAASRSTTVARIALIRKRARGGNAVVALPQENFIRSHGIAVDPLRNGNCGFDAVGLAISYMQANDTSSEATPTANIANDINQLRRDLYNHAQDYCQAFSRHYQSIIKDSGQRAEEWYTQHVLNRLYTPGRDYATDGADGDQWLDGPYGCPIISDFFQVKLFLYDLDGGSTTVYSPNISGHSTRRRTPQVTCSHFPHMGPPSPGSVALMKQGNHFYWLLPRSGDSTPSSSVLEIDADSDDESDDKGSSVPKEETISTGSGINRKSEGQGNSGLSEYEQKRLNNIERNNQRLKDLGLANNPLSRASKKAATKRSGKKSTTVNLAPTRRSTRIKKNANQKVIVDAPGDTDPSAGGDDDSSGSREAASTDISDAGLDAGGVGLFNDLVDEDDDDDDDGPFMEHSEDDEDEDEDEDHEEVSYSWLAIVYLVHVQIINIICIYTCTTLSSNPNFSSLQK